MKFSHKVLIRIEIFRKTFYEEFPFCNILFYTVTLLF